VTLGSGFRKFQHGRCGLESFREGEVLSSSFLELFFNFSFGVFDFGVRGLSFLKSRRAQFCVS
jgi:hypothetical protein